QAEDGIRDATVTGVQTCALPIYGPSIKTLLTSLNGSPPSDYGGPLHRAAPGATYIFNGTTYYGAYDSNNAGYSNSERKLFSNARSEERRVGKGCRLRGVREDMTR